MWEEKAREIDEREQEKWRSRIAESIVSSPWVILLLFLLLFLFLPVDGANGPSSQGANEASVDQITELHKKELAVLRKTHAVKQDMLEKKHIMRRKNFRNTILAEERKVYLSSLLLPLSSF
jgi:hypothetical protein